MRKLLIVVATATLALTVSAVGLATPGGLDRRGGHHCWTSCGKYGKYRGEYHCHRSPCSSADIRRHRAHGH
jgi:hypothetical protein